MDAKEMQSQFQATVDAGLEKIKDTTVSKEGLKTQLDEFQKEIKGAASIEKLAELKTALEDSIAEMKKTNENTEAAQFKQGEVLSKALQSMKKETSERTSEVVSAFIKGYKEKGGGQKVNALSGLFEIKSLKDDFSNAITIEDVATSTATGGSPSNVTGAAAWETQIIDGIFEKKRPISKILDQVRREPLNGRRLAALSEREVVGDAEFVCELGLKPIVEFGVDAEEVTAKKIALTWKTSEEMRYFYPSLAKSFERTAAKLVNEKLPDAIINGDDAVGIDGIKQCASAFTPCPELVFENPKHYHVIGAVITSLQVLGFDPRTIVMNPVAYALMKLSAGSDGQFNMNNGNSVQILKESGNTCLLDWCGNNIELILDPKLGKDEFILGDLDMVHVGAQDGFIYREFYCGDDGQRNLLTHALEKFVAILIPKNACSGIVFDTFKNVMTLITV